MLSGSDPSALTTGGSASPFVRQPGKVRRILCGSDDGNTVFIGGPSSLLLPPLVSAEVKGRAGTFPEIIVWNIKDPHADAGTIHSIPLPLDAGTSVLDMTWRHLRGISNLIVLSGHGTLVIFPPKDKITNNTRRLRGDSKELPAVVRIHPQASDPNGHRSGSLSCYESIIASTTGSDVALTVLQNATCRAGELLFRLSPLFNL
jgi:hypothetical protein